MPGGADAQIGLKTEAVVGTAETVDIFRPFVSESIRRVNRRTRSQTLNSRLTVAKVLDLGYDVAGPVNYELDNTDIATLLKHCFGDVTTTGAGPYTHTYEPGVLSGLSFTTQVGRPDSGGTVRPFTYAGCKVASWQIAANVDQIATFRTDIVAMTESTATGLASATTDADWCPFTFVEASVDVDGSPLTGTVRSFSLTGDNKVSPRRRIGAAAGLEPLDIGIRDYTGSIVMDFDDLTEYAKVQSGAEVAIELAFDNGTDSLTITMNAIYTGDTPTVEGQDLLAQSLPFEAMSTVDDATTITAVLVNGEASAA